ncbi:MAG TPA: hypothetical protein VHW26_10710 [Solirubrobacteraceae bacterium]|nr:hypothetical protein [Solirubrobacteraceae bacterium]
MLRRWLIPGALAILLLGISPAAAGAATPAASMIASAAPLTVGASEAGGGAHIDFWQMQLAGGDQVTVDFTGSSSNEYTFQLYAPGTTDATFSQLPAADTASTNGNSPDQITLQAPYTGNFVLAVCQNTGDCRDVLTGSGVNPMTPYTFTTTLPGGGITPAAATAETRATGTIDPAAPLTVGAFEAGGGGHADFWQMQLTGGSLVTLDFDSSSSNEYTFQLYAPGTTDATFSQAPAAVSAGTNGSSPDQITLQAPYTGNFVLAVCQNTGDCRDVLTGSGVNPMTPYTFTTAVPAPPVPIPPTPVPTLPVKGGGTSPPPVAPPPTASLRIARQTATVTATGRLAVRLTCAGAPCTGSIRLAAVVTTTTGTGRRRKTHTKTQTLGTAAFSKLAVGSHAVEVDLGAAGLAALRHHGYRLKSTATATYRSGSKTRKTTGAVSLTGTRPTRR